MVRVAPPFTAINPDYVRWGRVLVGGYSVLDWFLVDHLLPLFPARIPIFEDERERVVDIGDGDGVVAVCDDFRAPSWYDSRG